MEPLRHKVKSANRRHFMLQGEYIQGSNDIPSQIDLRQSRPAFTDKTRDVQQHVTIRQHLKRKCKLSLTVIVIPDWIAVAVGEESRSIRNRDIDGFNSGIFACAKCRIRTAHGDGWERECWQRSGRKSHVLARRLRTTAVKLSTHVVQR